MEHHATMVSTHNQKFCVLPQLDSDFNSNEKLTCLSKNCLILSFYSCKTEGLPGWFQDSFSNICWFNVQFASFLPGKKISILIVFLVGRQLHLQTSFFFSFKRRQPVSRNILLSWTSHQSSHDFLETCWPGS